MSALSLTTILSFLHRRLEGELSQAELEAELGKLKPDHHRGSISHSERRRKETAESGIEKSMPRGDR